MPDPLHSRSSRIGRDDHRYNLVSVDGFEGDPAFESEAIRVIIAYGDHFARSGIRALLEAESDMSVVACAADGDQAIALARHTQSDVMVIDIGLPGIDGIEVTRRLAVEGDASRCRVLILSASERDEEVFSSLRAGATGFMLNGIDPSDLARSVRTVATGGAMLSPRVARRVIRELTSRPDPRLPSPERLEELTPREREVMALVATGLTNEEIAEYLVVTRATAKTHVSRALGKLRVRGRAQLVTLAYETGLVVPKQTAATRASTISPRLAA